MFAGNDFFCAPSLGPLNLGHILIITDKHYHCLRDTPYSLRKNIIKISILLAKRMFLDENFVVFETGDSLFRRTESCISHTHVHITPVYNYNSNAFRQFKSISEDNVLGATPFSPINKDYILYYVKGDFFIMEEDKMPSQYMRRILFEMEGNPNNWNWRDAPNIQTMLETYNKHKEMVQEGILEICDSITVV